MICNTAKANDIDGGSDIADPYQGIDDEEAQPNTTTKLDYFGGGCCECPPEDTRDNAIRGWICGCSHAGSMEGHVGDGIRAQGG